MNKALRFPFQSFEPLNAHGFTTEGHPLHVKVEFIRYLENYTEEDEFNCVISCDDVHSYSNSKGLWRDGETLPQDVSTGHDMPYFEIDKPIQDPLTEKDIDSLKVGDKLIHPSSGRLITVVSTKEAPTKIRLKDETDNTYYNAIHDSMTNYGWRLTEARV